MELLAFVRDAFHSPSTRTFRITENVSSVLIAFSVLLLAIELWQPQTYAQNRWLHALDRVVLALFTLELFLRVATWDPPVLRVHALSPAGRLRAHVLGRVRYML